MQESNYSPICYLIVLIQSTLFTSGFIAIFSGDVCRLLSWRMMRNRNGFFGEQSTPDPASTNATRLRKVMCHPNWVTSAVTGSRMGTMKTWLAHSNTRASNAPRACFFFLQTFLIYPFYSLEDILREWQSAHVNFYGQLMTFSCCLWPFCVRNKCMFSSLENTLGGGGGGAGSYPDYRNLFEQSFESRFS